MDPDAIAPMIVMVTLILTTGGVILLRPLAKHLAAYLQVLTDQKRVPPPRAELGGVQETLDRMERRLTLIEERQQFSEDLLRTRQPSPSLPPAEGGL